jgi:predicted HAD superfamily Cof-like phosphohydrolase
MIVTKQVADALVIMVDGEESVAAFKTLVHRATNLWPDAPPEVKEFADEVTNFDMLAFQGRENKGLQDYQFARYIKERWYEMTEANFQLKIRSFEGKILYFNGMYKLPVAKFPSTGLVANDVKAKNPNIKSDKQAIIKRLDDFKVILYKELEEVEAIVAKLSGTEGNCEEIDVLTELADWLGDIQVYCASEMAKFGLPNEEVLSIIMSSNFSKLGPNGEPIYDDNGKVMKGPGYWKPEPQIKQLLKEKIEEGMPKPSGIVWRE